MMQSFSLGIRQIWDELSALQSPGFYWINIDRQVDATLFCQQVISAQAEDSRVALICCGDNSESLFTPLPITRLKQLPCYLLPEKKAALLGFTDDLTRALKPKKRLFILYAPASLWRDFTQEKIHHWIMETGDWLRQRQCTLLVLSHGSGVSRLKTLLASLHRALYGLASLQWQQDRAQYLVSWWGTAGGISANQVQMLLPDQQGWRMAEEDAPELTPSFNDDGTFLAEKSVLEGAPALSGNWQLFDDNELLAQNGALAHAATLIFALHQTGQVDALVRQVHSLRRQRGSQLKIVVREMKPCLRASDERLLLACGANIIVTHSEPLSRFLSRLESVQGQRFSKRVPADVDQLLTTMRPLQIKGYQSLEAFRDSVRLLLESSQMPEGSKGILIALRPVPGLRAAQALTLCSLRRFGDVVTISQGRVLLFLSNCRMNELETALKSIFRLPVDEVFSNRLVWSQDSDILSEIKMLSSDANDDRAQQVNDYARLPQREPENPALKLRRQPVPITILTRAQEEKA